MTLRRPHGQAARYSAAPRIEVLPVDELPAGVPADARPESPTDRGDRGHFAPGNGLARKGGQARKGKTLLAERLSLGPLMASDAFKPYQRSAVSFRRAKCAELAASVGAGFCGSGPSSIVATAALQLAASRYLFAVASETGDAEAFAQASKLGNDSRQNLLAAHELCAREAQARPEAPVDLSRFGGTK